MQLVLEISLENPIAENCGTKKFKQGILKRGNSKLNLEVQFADRTAIFTLPSISSTG